VVGQQSAIGQTAVTNHSSKSFCAESQRCEDEQTGNKRSNSSSNMIIRRHVASAAAISSPTAGRFQSTATTGSPLYAVPKSERSFNFRLRRLNDHGFKIPREQIHSAVAKVTTTTTTSCQMSSDVTVFDERDEENTTSTITSWSSSSSSDDSENDSANANANAITVNQNTYLNTTIPTGDLAFENAAADDSQGKIQLGTVISEADETPPMAILLLNLVAVIWGSQHAIIKTVVGNSDVAEFTFLRFALASLCALPYLPGIQSLVLPSSISRRMGLDDTQQLTVTIDSYKETEFKKSWRWGAELGLWMFFGFSLQAVGLLTTSAQRSGFLLYLNVKLVPFFAYILLGRTISTLTWVSAFTAFSGTALLALDGQSIGLNVGDLWSVLAAAASAMFILRLEKASSEVPKSAELNATSLFVVAFLSGIWAVGQRGAPTVNSLLSLSSDLWNISTSHPLELFFLGAISTAMSNFIQAKAQRYVPAERASIIYSLDPVYGALFSWIILGETLGGVQAYVGAAMVTVAAATNSLLEFSKQSSDDKDEL
jgi:drug/metabolite transporter (DMT)-like permease